MADYYVNDAVRKMYGIPLSQLTPKQRKILREDGERRKKLIEERQKEVMQDNRKAFDDAEKLNRVLVSIYSQCQKEILADVSDTLAKVKKAGGEWSYANQSALTRSRGLFEQINKELVKLGKKEQTFFRQNLTNIYTDQFLRSIYTLGQTQPLQMNGSFNMLNPRLVEAALDYPWSGAMFSDRLWLDKDRLGRNLRIGLTQSMILGEDMDKIADRIQANIDTSRYNAMRIARTETKRVTYVSQVAAWKEQGIKKVRYMAANNGGDSRTCDLCRADSGKEYALGDEPTLPRHPNCRCWYVPVTPDTFEDNELNELTGSVRGAENYEKWKQEYEVALNPDGSYKPGWKRESWKDGGRVMYTAADGKKYTLQEYKDAVRDNVFCGGVKKPTAEELIRKDIEQKRKEAEIYRKEIQAQIEAKQEYSRTIPSQYADQFSEIERKKSVQSAIMEKKQKDMDDLELEIESIRGKRQEIYDLIDSGKISESEADELLDKLRADRKRLRGLRSERENEFYQAHFEIEKLNEDVKRIQQEIKKKQNDIVAEVIKLEDKVRESLASEIDFDLDISYVGDSMDRLGTVDQFRSIREALRDNSTFDMDKYKDELVQMAQRMDKDALTIHQKLSKITSANLYNSSGGAAYYPAERKVKMNMSSNSHERALGNGLKGSWQTKYHEEGHQLDHLLGNVSQFADIEDDVGSFHYLKDFTYPGTVSGKKMTAAIEKDILNFLNTAVKYSNDEEGQSYKPIKGLSRITSDARHAFSRYMCYLTTNGVDNKVSCQLGVFTDAIGLFTRDKLSVNTLSCGGWGHSSAYNKERGKAGATSETWATFCALRTCGSKEEIEMMKKVMPETWDCMNGVFHEVAVYLEEHELSY